MVTSGSEVVVPRGADELLMLLDQCTGAGDVALRQTVIPRELDRGLDPELRFPVRRHDVDVVRGSSREK